MYTETVQTLADQAVAKLAAQRRSLLSHFIRSMMAGMYVGAAIVLIFTVGSFLPREVQKLLMGVCFGGALTVVVFAGSELFTGSNLVLTLGVFTRRASAGDLLSNWVWTWIGNLAGKKMNLPVDQLFLRAVLANWFVCLGVWMAARLKSETARVLMIWWCMFTFITSGYEHSIANMCGLMLGQLLPHGEAVTWGGYWYNLGLATLGNIVGGAVFVAGVYWVGSPTARAEARERLTRLEATANGTADRAAAGLALAPEA